MTSHMRRANGVEHVCGDSSAAAQLEFAYGNYAGRIYALCLRLLADRRQAESATAKVFSRFSRIMRRPDGPSTITYLRELAFEETLIRLRRHPCMMKSPVSLRARLLRSLRVKKRHVALAPAIVSDLIVRLPDHMRAAFVLHDVEGLSDSAIAERLFIERETVRRRVHAARIELRTLWLNGDQ